MSCWDDVFNLLWIALPLILLFLFIKQLKKAQ